MKRSMSETKLLEKTKEYKEVANDLDQTKHQLNQIKVDLNSKNQKLSALVTQLEDTSKLDKLVAKVDKYEKTFTKLWRVPIKNRY